MKSRFLVLSVALVLCLSAGGLSAGKPKLMTPEEFTRAHVSSLREKHPDVKVEVLKDLELKIIKASESTQVSLQRSYEIYVEEPERLPELMGRFVRGQAESLAEPVQSVASDRIVPMIKTRGWLAARPGLPIYSEDLSSDLIVIYGQDFPDTIKYLNLSDLAPAGLTKEGLRPLAVKNLLERLKIEPHSYPCCYMLTAGGDYEASLILADSILKDYQDNVEGSLVIAIPAPNLFLLTGSENEKGLSLLRETIDEQKEKGTLLGPNLFLYKDGKLTEMPPKG